RWPARPPAPPGLRAARASELGRGHVAIAETISPIGASDPPIRRYTLRRAPSTSRVDYRNPGPARQPAISRAIAVLSGCEPRPNASLRRRRLLQPLQRHPDRRL